MIKNATLQRVDAPGLTLPGGDSGWSTGSAISIRCCVQGMTQEIRRMVDQLKLQADTQLYVALADWPAAGQTLQPNARVVLVPDPLSGVTFPPASYLIQAADLVRGGLTAVRCVLRSE